MKYFHTFTRIDKQKKMDERIFLLISDYDWITKFVKATVLVWKNSFVNFDWFLLCELTYFTYSITFLLLYY